MQHFASKGNIDSAKVLFGNLTLLWPAVIRAGRKPHILTVYGVGENIRYTQNFCV